MSRVTRMVLTIVIAVLIAGPALAATPASASGKPTRLPVPNSFNTFDFPAGQACSNFELAGAPVVNNEVYTTFPPEANGDVVQLVTGYLLEQVTNVGTGKSIIVNISGPAKFVSHSDGSVTFIGYGSELEAFFPTDFPAGPRTFINYGLLVINITPLDQFILVSQSGHQFDVCAALI